MYQCVLLSIDILLVPYNFESTSALAPFNPRRYDKTEKTQFSNVKLLFLMYLAAALVYDTILFLSSILSLITNPYCSAVSNLNCQNPIALEEETASGIRALS